MLLSDFDYTLPADLIAQYPSEKRDCSKLMVLSKSTCSLEHKRFFDIISYLRPDDCLVLNDSKVLKARLHGFKDTGAAAEILLIRRCEEDIWEAMVKPGRRLKPGSIVYFDRERHGVENYAEILDYGRHGTRIIKFTHKGDFMSWLETAGEMPIPPYIARKPETIDNERYQTVYSSEPGSVAAPTAGLHFTGELLSSIRGMGVELAKVTLHVGPGTFLPVKSEDIDAHKMHTEVYHVSAGDAEIINTCKANGGRIICVGTTAVRTLESAANVEQEYASIADSEQNNTTINEHRSEFRNGLTEQLIRVPNDEVSNNYRIRHGNGSTDIFIRPGYEFKMCDGLITNFHLPKSTLLMLVSAFYGRDRLLRAYAEAVSAGYRFFSYGDAMLII